MLSNRVAEWSSDGYRIRGAGDGGRVTGLWEREEISECRFVSGLAAVASWHPTPLVIRPRTGFTTYRRIASAPYQVLLDRSFVGAGPSEWGACEEAEAADTPAYRR